MRPRLDIELCPFPNALATLSCLALADDRNRDPQAIAQFTTDRMPLFKGHFSGHSSGKLDRLGAPPQIESDRGSPKSHCDAVLMIYKPDPCLPAKAPLLEEILPINSRGQTVYAFCDGDGGGNAAGVVIGRDMPSEDLMQAVASRLGYSETVFATPNGDGWRTRYFAPQMEVPFCGHATIALGAALASEYGDGVYKLILNSETITVEGAVGQSGLHAALQSPATASEAADRALVSAALALFDYRSDDLDLRIPPAVISAGARHLVLGLNSRQALANMRYDLMDGKRLMMNAQLVTIVLAFAESDQLFHTRNPFASGGIYEDPATGAATAAFAGYLRDLGWPHGGTIHIVQGEDMGQRCKLRADIPLAPGSSIRVSGNAKIVAADVTLEELAL